jgi:UDP-glucose 4-epimerase
VTTRVWVIGGRGLLGKSVRRAVASRPDWVLFEADPLPWGNGPQLAKAANATMVRLVSESQEAGHAWSVFWVAGAAVTSSPEAKLREELAEFGMVLNAIRRRAIHPSSGSLFIASSAGGVYGGSANPPFTEDTRPSPLGGYGRLKLDVEEAARVLATDTGIPVLIGRITNLYGPGQRLDKLQGLISHLASSSLTGLPVRIFVPLDTVRDYFFVDDCADLILRAMDRLVRESRPAPLVVTKILGSGQSVTIGSLLGYLRGITKKRPRIILGSTEATTQQGLDLRASSIIWRDLDSTDKTPIVAGFHSTILDLTRTLERERER